MIERPYRRFSPPRRRADFVTVVKVVHRRNRLRFGELVFASNGATDFWDGTYKGKKAASGAYVYVIDLKNNSPLIKGEVLIIR